MGLPIRFCQEGFLGHTYPLRPMLYISGDKVCQTQGVSSVWINFPGRTLLQDLEWRGSCTPTSVEERLLSLSHFLTPTHPRGGVMLVCGLESPQLSPLCSRGPPPLPHSSEHPSSAGWGRPAGTLLLHPGLSGWVQPGWGSMGCTSMLSSSSQLYPG